jgi:hypothetical protein
MTRDPSPRKFRRFALQIVRLEAIFNLAIDLARQLPSLSLHDVQENVKRNDSLKDQN